MNHREEQAQLHTVTEDYKSHKLHGGSGYTIRTEWGGYSIKGEFHFVWSDIEVYRKKVMAHGGAIRVLDMLR